MKKVSQEEIDQMCQVPVINKTRTEKLQLTLALGRSLNLGRGSSGFVVWKARLERVNE